MLRVGVSNNGKAEVWTYDNYNYEDEWTPMSSTGFDANDTIVRTLFVDPSGNFYAGTSNNSGAEVYQFDIGPPPRWTAIGNLPNNITSVRSMVWYNNKLYIGVRNDTDGANIYRYDGGGTLTAIASAGFGDPTQNTVVWDMAVFQNKLYAYVSGALGSTDSLEIYRYDGSSWEKVVGEGKSLGRGFGYSSNLANSMINHQDSGLYVSTIDVDQGGQVWHSPNGTDWTQINLNGFGQSSNYAVSALEVVSLNSYLVAGTYNDDGAEAWWVDLEEVENPVPDSFPTTGKYRNYFVLILGLMAIFGLYILPNYKIRVKKDK